MFLRNDTPKMSSLCAKVCCWLYGVRLGCVGRVGLWVQSFRFAMGRVGLKKLDPRGQLCVAMFIFVSASVTR